VLTPAVDTRVDDNVAPTLSAYLFGSGADAARTVLSAIAGSPFTATALTFSLTVVTLQLASSQFSRGCCGRSPATRSSTGGQRSSWARSPTASWCYAPCAPAPTARPEFVPKISITVAVVQTLVSVLALVLFLDHHRDSAKQTRTVVVCCWYVGADDHPCGRRYGCVRRPGSQRR